ncbi:MAG: hypothetical protein M3081_21990 [Gemmatimonadota bacterium]|nr:hypothetical protein [Gemmatimonadota bacterium]
MIEMLIAMSIMVLIFSMALPFFKAQTRTLTDYGGRLDAQQNARFAFNTIDRELRVAGVGVLDLQPMLVQADSLAVTFNADLVSRDSGDASAIYYNPSVLPSLSTSLLLANQVTLPRSSRTYPAQNYISGSNPSFAETISFYMASDVSTGRSDLYQLMRRVNDGTPRIVAKNVVLRSGDAPVFRYFRDSAGSLAEIPRTVLPLYHVAVHGGPLDTGRVSWLDSIRVVRISFTGLYVDPKLGDVTRKVEGSIRLLNIGLQNKTTCGDVPISSALAGITQNNPPGVVLTWTASPDQAGGEKDVERYAIYRRVNGTTAWGDPFVSVPATGTIYSYTDTQVIPGQRWDYGLVAQDCTPVNSTMSIVSPGVIPPPP